MTTSVTQYKVAELDLGPAPSNSWDELDVEFVPPAGRRLIVPAFISDGHWRVRYSSGQVGIHTWTAQGPQDSQGEIQVVERGTALGRLDRGPLSVSPDSKSFVHADGEPFLWLGDTWWHGFVTPKISDEEFSALARQRNEQGFTVVQIVAGLPCEVQPFDEANRARSGFAWNPDFESINLEWWDDADRRIAALVDNDLLPCVLGSWGYHFGLLNEKQFRRHWREIVARWAAYPVVWCLSGEPSLPNYQEMIDAFDEMYAEGAVRAAIQEESRAGGSEWGPESVFAELSKLTAPRIDLHNRILRHVKESDPFGRLMTTHMIPGAPAWTFVDDEALIDFWMLQTGHAGFHSLVPTIAQLEEALAHEPRKPVVNGEVNYEGIADSSWEDIQRFLFWAQLMAGAAGWTYGAHGLWAFNTDEFPGQHSGDAPHWKIAAKFNGASQVGAGRRLLDSYPWHNMRPAPDTLYPHAGEQDPTGSRSVVLEDGRRLIYISSMAFQAKFANPTYLRLGEQDWEVRYIDVKTGAVHSVETLRPDSSGSARVAGRLAWALPTWGDWLIELRPLSATGADVVSAQS